ncbi:MAG: outer membrane lipoprotein chaperone LolA [Endozoicomonas sp.]
MLKKLTLLPVFTVIFSQLAWAAPASEPLVSGQPAVAAEKVNETKENDKKAADQLARKLDDIRTISARFKQDAIATDGRLATESGKIQMKRPGRFRWVTELPYEQEIIARDDKVWMIDKDLQQVIIQKQDERMANTPAQLLSGNAVEILKRYRVAVFSDKGVEKYTLLPAGESGLFEKLDITFRQGELESMEMRDSLGGRRRISFTEVNVNGMISSSRFKVRIPKNFDVIDESGS